MATLNGELLDELRARLLRRWAELEDEPTDEVDEKLPSEPTTEVAEGAAGQESEESAGDPVGDSVGVRSGP